MSDRGLYKKYSVMRMDGTSSENEKHYDCRYFVLDLDHDDPDLLVPAIDAYVTACRKKGIRVKFADALMLEATILMSRYTTDQTEETHDDHA